MTLSLLALYPGGLGVGLERGSGFMGGCAVGQWGRRGSCEGTGGLPDLPFGLTAGAPFRVGEPSTLQTLMGLLLPDFSPSVIGLTSTFVLFLWSNFCSQCRSPREWERFNSPAGCGGPSRSSQLRLAGMGDRLWPLRSPSKLKPFREGLMNKLLGNFVRWFLLFCCSASVERVMGSVG